MNKDQQRELFRIHKKLLDMSLSSEAYKNLNAGMLITQSANNINSVLVGEGFTDGEIKTNWLQGKLPNKLR